MTATTATETAARISRIADRLERATNAHFYRAVNPFGGEDLGRDHLVRLYSNDTTIELVAFDPTRPAAKIIAWSASFEAGTPDAIIADAATTAIAWAQAGTMINSATPVEKLYRATR